MSKFSKTQRIVKPSGPLSASTPAITHEGGKGYTKDAKTALFTLAVTNMVGENTFYEKAGTRDNRYVSLIHQVTTEDPEWMQGFIPWLRNKANMRSASVVAAVEYVKAGGPNGRKLISSVCLRADEPAEVLGYYWSRYGKSLPAAIKRGVADAAVRLYTERNTLKYDTPSHAIRFGDVIELTHPKLKSTHRLIDGVSVTTYTQSNLFRHLIDRRHNRETSVKDLLSKGLIMLALAHKLDSLKPEDRRVYLETPHQLTDAGYTWERLSGWVPGGMDAKAWEAIIPSMGYMALLRNLRNFEDKGVSKTVLGDVAAKLHNSDQVAKSRQFPYRFWSAYKNSGTVNFAPALEMALELSVQNIPELKGRTLIMVDTSASMGSVVSNKSKVKLVEIAALFGAALANRNGKDKVVLAPYANETYKATIHNSVLRTIQDIESQIGKVGHGTETWYSTNKMIRQYGPFDRVVVFSDMQDHSAYNWYASKSADPPKDIPVYVWDLEGYANANVNTNNQGHYLFGGFSDQAFNMIGLLEAGKNADWPWND